MIAGNKKKIELLITGMGVIILIFLITNYMPKSKGNRTVLKTALYPTSVGNGFTSVPNTSLSSTSVRGKPFPTEVEPGDNIKWGRDTFFMDSNSAIEQGMEDLVLNGTVSDKDNPYAIINNEIVKLGDKVSGMTIIEINEKNVVLDENGQRRTLELNVY